jgi:hypothetical protein
MKMTKTTILALLLAFAIGGMIGGETSPSPAPKPDRPAGRWIGRIARLGLWFLAIGEPAPMQHQHVGAIDGELDHYRSL